jgi:hypothetical protein
MSTPGIFKLTASNRASREVGSGTTNRDATFSRVNLIDTSRKNDSIPHSLLRTTND